MLLFIGKIRCCLLAQRVNSNKKCTKKEESADFLLFLSFGT